MKKTILSIIAFAIFTITPAFAGNYTKQLSVTGGSKQFQKTIPVDESSASVNVSAHAYRTLQWSAQDFVSSTIIILDSGGNNAGEATIQLPPYYPNQGHDYGSYTGCVSDLKVYMTVMASPGNTSTASVSASW